MRRAIGAGAAVGIALVATTAWLASRPPTAACGSESSLDSNSRVVVASKVVAQPWYGRHNVYAIFQVPNRFRDRQYSTTVRIQGVPQAVALSQSSVDVHGGVVADAPDQYTVHAHIQTRAALTFLASGHFGDLRANCNWTLAFADEKSN